jgi:type I restriction enzyme S subunit
VAPLGWLLSSIKYGTSKRSEYGVNGTPVLRIPNVSDGRLRLVDLKFAAFLDRELQDLALVPGDILMIRSNGSPQLVGRSVLVNSDAQGMAYAGYLMRLRTDLQVIAPAYMTAALATLDTRRQIEMPLRSTSGVNNINTDEVRSLRIAVPPLDEQTEIVRQVDQLTELADDLIRRIDAAEHRVDLTSQAVLAKAFRGELLPYGASIVSSKADVR